METNIHIERLVIEGLTLSPRQRAQLQAALGEELARLLQEGSLAPELAGGAALASLPAPAIALLPDQPPAVVGRQIAGALYASLGAGAPTPGGERHG
jgi:hypothetical protein